MKMRKIVAVLALFSLLSAATGGYLYYQSAKESAFKEAEGDLVAKSQLLKDHVVRLISSNHIEAIERELSQVNVGIALLVHSSGIVFVSSQAKYLFHLLWQVRPEEVSRIAVTKQFGNGPWNWTGLKKTADNRVVDESGETHLIQERELENCPAWRLAYLYNIKSIYRKLVDPLVGTAGYVGLILFVFVCVAVIVLYRMAQIDIRSRKQAEEALSRSEKKYRELYENIRDGFVAASPDGKITEFNRSFKQMLGYEDEEILRLSYEDITPSQWHPKEAEIIESQVIKRGYSDVYEKEYARKNGTIFPVELRTYLISDDHGGYAGTRAFVRDISERRRVEEAARIEKRRFEVLAEHLPFGLVMIDDDGTFQYVNPKFQEIFGYELKDIPNGKEWFKKAYPESEYRHQVIAAWLGDLAKSGPGEHRPRVFTVTCKDGQNKIVHFRVVQLQTSEHLMTCEDITDGVRAEKTLSEYLSMLENILDKAGDGICVCHNTQEFPYVQFTHWNPRMTEITGYTLEEINGGGWYQSVYLDPDTQMRAIERMARMRMGDDIRAEEWVITSKEGTQKPLSISTSIIKEEEGQIHVLAIMQDIAERKKDEAALRESEERFRSTFEQAAVGICHVSPDGRFLRANQKLCDILGYTSDDLLSRTFQEITYPDDLEADLEYVNQVLAGEVRTYSMEKRYIRKDGSHLWANLTVSLASEPSGAPKYLISVVEDISIRKTTEQARRDSETKYRTLVEESFDGIFVQQGTKIVFANSRLSEMLGYTESELVGKDHWEVYHPYYHELTRSRALARMRGESVPSRYEVKLQRKDGSSFDGEINARAVTIEGQAGVQVWIRDVTERKMAEESLRESEERYRELFDNSADLIYTHDLEGNYTSVNKAVEKLLGYTPEEFLNLNFRQVVHPDYLKVTDENFRMEVNGKVDQTGPYEVLLCTKAGRPLWLEVNSRIIVHEGCRMGIHGTARDISDRKAAHEQLRKLFTALQQAGEVIVITDPMGTIEYVNPSFEATTGYSFAEAIGNNPRILKSGRHGRSFYQEMWETITTGAVWRGRLTNRRKDGTLYEETATISPVKDETGRIVNFVAVKRDVTSEVMLQKQLFQAQKMEAIGTLAGGIAHDFNNLLQAILGYSDLLLMKKGPRDPDRAKLEVIQHAARDGADLVGRILTFSRKGESKIRPIDLNDEIRRVEKLLRRTLPRMIQIDLLLAEDLKIIDADPAQIEQVLLNLGVNAQHAMPDGGQLLIETLNVSLSDEYVSAHLGARPGQYVLLTVSDTGVGMEPDVLDRIFEPFFTTKTNGEGTGLGLAMIHGIVAQHGGHIGCYSEPGKGTSFKIYFPVSAGELISDRTLTREMPAYGSETILLVDDDDRIREMGQQLIKIGGYKVIMARSGEEALEMYAMHRKEISLIILDLIMPGMGGNRCLQELLRIDPDVRVLVASGYSENGLTVGKKGAGTRGFVRKPYDAKDILGAIRRVLDEGHL